MRPEYDYVVWATYDWAFARLFKSVKYQVRRKS